VNIEFPKVDLTHTLVFDFDGVFTDNKVYFREDGLETVCCDRADGLALDFLRHFRATKNLDLDWFILSKEKNAVVEARAKKLQMPVYQGVGDKLEFLKNYFAERRADNSDNFAGMIYLGNDLNDLPVISQAGFSVVPGDAHPMIKDVASVVLQQNGGNGFVRAFVEKFLGLDAFTIGQVNELISNS